MLYPVKILFSLLLKTFCIPQSPSRVRLFFRYTPGHQLSSASALSAPRAAITALRQCDDQIEMMRDEYNRRRRYVVKALNEMGLTCFEPRGAFYVFPSIQISGLTSSEFCEQLLREKEVAIIPGSAFGASGEGYARISYAYSVDHLQTAMKRIREFLTEHGWMKK